MAAGGGVLRRVLVRGGITAADVAAAAADPKVYPSAADLEAILAAGYLVRGLDANLVEVRADGSHHQSLLFD
jgi:hypothetical protein